MRQQIQQFGRTLSSMVMPNIGAFIAWGFITALFIPEGWWPNGQLAQLVGPMLTYLLPLLIAYTAGRNVAGERGGVIGAIAAVGVIVGSDIPMFIGAMIMGPLAGYAIRRFDRMVEGRVKAGFEMLVSNFSIGILGMLLAVLGYYVVGSVVSGLTMLISSGAELVIRHGLLPLVSLFVEPAKVLFLNNAVNHGIFSPIGIEQARETGQSIMFLLETNPGPGLGVLLAYWLFGRGNARQSAPGAVIIQFFGGIHEIYFPYILARPVLIVAAIAGSAAGLLFFSLSDAGLVAPASPGSILSVLAMAPKGKTLIVLLGVVISAAVSLVVAAPFIRRASKTETEGDPAVGKLPQSAAGISPHAAGRPVRKVIFACDAGMGSSALGATRFRKRLRDAEIGVAVGNSAADRIPSDADVVVCQSVLAERIAAAAKGAELIVIDNFLSDPGLDALFARLESAKPTAAGPGTVSCGESDSDMSDARLAEAVLPSDVCDARSAGATPSSETSAFRPAETTASPDMPVAADSAPQPEETASAPKDAAPDGAILQPGNIRVGLPAEPKEEAIRRAGELLVAGGYARPEYVDAMLRREELATTCLGMGLAIPHGTSDAKERVLRSGIVVLQYPDGVDFDGEKAHLIVGIAGVGDEHLEILARLSASFEDEELLQRLMTATDPQVIYDALK
ncbi:PTS mannitol transporter subunit IICBA [Alistipes finegoldii]|jgi:PTS system mannitol-specific IIC component|uniref:PTS mannitol transporter subunit IICBA n=1 Tax=Alistipes finegoldii TaxID=214856 RepID=UPI0026761EB7|nr:PTS mannitol transporter subunit IICBA [Alistipes finegoldii]